MFVNRADELAALEQWWRRPGSSMGQVWGRRRVGKTALISEFASGRRTVFHTARGVGLAEELATLATKIPSEFELERRMVRSMEAAGRGDVEIDAVVLAGTPPAAVAVGEATWADRIAASLTAADPG